MSLVDDGNLLLNLNMFINFIYFVFHDAYTLFLSEKDILQIKICY